MRPTVDRRQGGQGPDVELTRTRDLLRHQRSERRRDAALEDIRSGDAMILQLILRQIDAATPRVLTDIADDVGELDGDA